MDKWQTIGIIFVLILVIGLIVVISSSFSSFLNGVAGTKTQTPTLTFIPSPVPTDTVPPGQPTSTPVPPVLIGEDWIQGCISTLWQAYPSTVQPIDRGNGCWQEPLHAFLAENGDLDFLFERPSGGPEVYGLFAPLPESGIVTFTIRLQDLSNADLLMSLYVFEEKLLDYIEFMFYNFASL